MAVSDQTLLTGKQLDSLCINTIRTLAIDAVQQANSGHPGAPMALAPVAYSLWQHFLRYDPADPIWPNRDRFILSNGHASMLLYAMLYLTEVRGVNPEGEGSANTRSPSMTSRSFRQLDSKTPGHPEYAPDRRRRNHHRPAGPGRRHQRGHGDRRQLAGGALQPSGLRNFQLQRLRLLRRRRFDGRHRQRSRLARRASQASQSVLDLRQQPHHPRWPCRVVFH